MQLTDLKCLLNEVISQHPTAYTRALRAHQDFEDIQESLIKFTPLLVSPKIKLKTRIYWVVNGLNEIPQCLHCGKAFDETNVSLTAGYPLHCSNECAKASAHRKEVYAQNFKAKHGVENPSQLESVKEQKAVTCLTNYGVKNPSQSGTVQQKMKSTCLERYGVEHVTQSRHMIDASKATCCERYGVSSFSKTTQFTQKVELANLEKFGVKYPNQDPAFRKQSQKKYYCFGQKFDSKLELAYFIWLRDKGIQFEYQPDVAFEFEVGGKVHKYMPDFKVGDQLVELKGLHFFKDRDPTQEMVNPYDHSQDATYEAKRQCMIKNNIKILTDNDCQEAIKYLKSKYGNDFLKKAKTT